MRNAKVPRSTYVVRSRWFLNLNAMLAEAFLEHPVTKTALVYILWLKRLLHTCAASGAMLPSPTT